MEKTAVLKEKNNNITQTTTDSNKKIINLSVIKRNGSITPFKADKITNAIKKHFSHKQKLKIILMMKKIKASIKMFLEFLQK